MSRLTGFGRLANKQTLVLAGLCGSAAIMALSVSPNFKSVFDKTLYGSKTESEHRYRPSEGMWCNYCDKMMDMEGYDKCLSKCYDCRTEERSSQVRQQT